MRLAGRISAAIEVLTEVEQRHRPVSEALKAWGFAHRFAGAGDRAAIGNLVYDALRRRQSHAQAMQSDAPRALVLSVVVRDWGEPAEALANSFTDDRHAPEPITETEMEALRRADGPAVPDVPEWLQPSLERALGSEWIAEMQAMAERPPLDLRVNTLKSSVERVANSLKRFSPQSTDIAPTGLRLPAGQRDSRTPNVTTDEGYQKGWFEIQDQGSQIVSLLAGAQPGEQVLDLCAGGGGKTLAMAAAMDNRGQIFAHDSDRSRLAPIYDRLKRSGVRNAQVRPPEPEALDDLAGRMDRVLIDAPCTGTGTWRRRPDTKWKLSTEQLQLRVAEQQAILDAAVASLKPGGTLVYITCSLLPEENADQVADFHRRHEGFEDLNLKHVWTSYLNGDFRGLDMPHGLLLTPLRTGTDGFYIAALKRTATR
ncbi:MFS transporter [Devosia pacifica]|uniref:MFS transporter n=1 Tax=Devosia pacifica TaxID=1335967 RepID=A0A918SC47_9HYPH|nr:RsmB/NOP family class I SAM-dependent RNA methyltransferase [Devosia pacifica]GHA35141.1 MFS transporter [Devosia pacifica]